MIDKNSREEVHQDLDQIPGSKSSSVRCWMLHSLDPLMLDIEGKVEGSMHKVVVEKFKKEVRVGSLLGMLT